MPLVSIILNIPVDNLALSFWQDGITTWNTNQDEQPTNKIIQHEWDKIVLKTKIENDFKFNDPKDVARLNAITNKEAGVWLHAFPSKNIGMYMGSFQICIGLRLGSKLCREYQCKCGERVDRKGLHSFTCSKNSGSYYRHTEINDILKRALTSAGIPAQLEPVGFDQNDGKRPDGATVVPWDKGKCLIWDFTCSDTFAASYINITKDKPGAAAELAVKRKHLK